jgi:hypothetical protein
MKWVGNRDELAVCLANAASAERGDRLQVFTAADNWRAPQWSIPMDINADVGLALAFSTNSDRYAYSSTLSKGANSDGSVRVQTTLLLSSFGQPGSSSRRLAESQGSFDIAGFTRAGKWLLYWKEDEVSASILADGLEFFAVNIADGSKPHKLDIETLVYGDMIAICPTKEGVAVTSGFGRETWANKAIAIVDLNSGEPAVRVLTEPAMAAQLPAWSPNGETLAWCSGPDAEFLGKQELLAKGQKTIMVEGPRQGQRKQIPITPQLRLGADPQTVQRCMRSRRIYTANLSKNDRPQQLTNDSQYADEQPIWSANGDHILFCRLDAKDARTIWLMRNNGAEARQIAGPLRPPPEIYYGHTEWRSLFDWWRGPVS